jgi:hypothetical protein
MRLVFSTSSVNFELKSEMEQEALIGSYQGFLNSLDFPVQIIVQSRKLNLDTYLESLSRRAQQADNELLRAQTLDYVGFIESVITRANIMQKKFYVVVPHEPSGFKQLGALSKLISANPGNVQVQDFENEKRYLMQKAETVASGLAGVGIRAIQLNTQELIELYYGVYNPEQAQIQKLISLSQLESEIISKQPEEMDIG